MEVLPPGDLAAAVAECRRRAPAAAVLPLPAGAGVEPLLAFLRERGRRIAVYLYADSGAVPEAVRQRALAAGARGFLATGPRRGDTLCHQVAELGRALRRRLREDQARAGLFRPYNLVGASAAMHNVFRRAVRANRFHDLPVLIEGEAGTPRRRLASAILYLDPTAIRMPYFALDCRAMKRILSPGPQTDRWQDLLRAASGGTLFLDHIASLDTPLQAILQRTAQRRPPEVRILAATEGALRQQVLDGVFDPDLAACLGLFRIPLPSLRGRPEDIARQAQHVLDTLQTGRYRPARPFEPGVVEALQRQPWEGNTRQLEAVLRQALGAADAGSTLRLDDLPPWLRQATDAISPEPSPHPGDLIETPLGEASHPWDQAIDPCDRRLLATLLKRQGAGTP